MIQFNCPKCRSTLSVADDNAGRHTWCRSCQRVVMVPAALGEGPAASALPTELAAAPPSVDLASQRAETDRLRGALEDARTEHNRNTMVKSEQLDALEHSLDSVRVERDELAHDLNDQHARVTKLEQALEQAEQDSSESNAEIRNLEAIIASTESTPSIAPPMVDDRAVVLERERAALEAELVEIRGALAQRDRDINELRRASEDTEALRVKNDRLESAVRERDSLRAQLKTLNETAKSGAAALTTLQERLRDTEANNASLTQQIQEADISAQGAATERQTEELNALRSQLDTAQRATETEQSALAEVQEKLWNAESENTSLNDRVRELEGQTADLSPLKEKAVAHDALQDEVNGLRERLDAATQAGADGQTAVGNLAEKLQQAESNVAELNTQVAELTNQTSELDALRQQAAKLGNVQRNADDLRQRLDAATQAGSDEQSAMADLQEKLRKSESLVAELNAQTSELDALRQQAATLDEVQRNAATLREQLQSANEAGLNDRNALTELQEKLRHAEVQITERDGRVAGLTEQVSEISGLRERAATLEEAQRDAANLREQLDVASAAQSEAEARCAEFEPRVQSLDLERANLAERLGATEKRADGAEERARQAETNLANRDAEMTQKDNLLAETRQDLETAREETATLRASLAEETAAASEAVDTSGSKSELEESRAELERKADEINSLSAELESERARANAAEAHAAMPDEEFAETDEPPALLPAETVSKTNADEQQSSDEEPPSEEDDMLDALMRFLGRQ